MVDALHSGMEQRLKQAKRGARRAANSQSEWIERLARVGYATKGVVYALIGVLALEAAIGSGGSVGGSRNAVETIGSQPFGQALLVITGIGLFGYALWRFIQAGFDPEDSRAIKRVGYVLSGAAHTMLGVTAIQMVIGGGGSGGSKKTWLAKLMAVDTVGPILVGVLGVVVIGYALYQVKKGWTEKFKEKLRTARMSRGEKKGATLSGRIGLVARGLVFAIVGGYVIKAAVTHDASSAKSVGGALGEIASQSYGVFLLAIVAIGLVAYAVLQFVMAKYRQIPASA